jgi:alkylhydroperoxidase family enzyme
MTEYHDRHLIEGALRPELLDAFNQLNFLTMAGNGIGFQLTMEVFTVASLAAGCRHCQSHGAYGLSISGVDTARIQALWSFESSELFSDADRAALRFALAAGSTPNGVTADHHREVRTHYTDSEIADILAVICIAGWLNRWNDSLATVTDQESVDWAEEHLAGVGWSPGKHTGATEEQRLAHPLTMISQGRDPFERDSPPGQE